MGNRFGSTLVSIHDSDVEDAMIDIVDSWGAGTCWNGVNRRAYGISTSKGLSSGWEYADGTTRDMVGSWNDNQPSGNGECGQFWTNSGGDTGQDDDSCDDANNCFICNPQSSLGYTDSNIDATEVATCIESQLSSFLSVTNIAAQNTIVTTSFDPDCNDFALLYVDNSICIWCDPDNWHSVSTNNNNSNYKYIREWLTSDENYVAVYNSNDTKYNVTEANDYCKYRFNSSLATIDTDNQLTDMMDRYSSESCWIGLKYVNDTFFWMDDSIYSYYFSTFNLGNMSDYNVINQEYCIHSDGSDFGNFIVVECDSNTKLSCFYCNAITSLESLNSDEDFDSLKVCQSQDVEIEYISFSFETDEIECIESLTAMMNVESKFDQEFGCQLYHDSSIYSDLSEEALYEITYDLYWLTDETDSESWEHMFSLTSNVIAESLDDIGAKTDSESQIGFNMNHKINFIDMSLIDETMVARYDSYNFSSTNYTFMLDKYSVSDTNAFDYTTDDWDSSDTCNGITVVELEKLAFDSMLADEQLYASIKNSDDNNANNSYSFYSVSLGNLISYKTATPSEFSIVNSNENFNVFLTGNSTGNLSVETNMNGIKYYNYDDNVNNTLYDQASDAWLFTMNLPKLIQFENNGQYSNKMSLSFEINLEFNENYAYATDYSSSISFVFVFKDSKYFVGVMLTCDNDHTNRIFTCYTSYYPSKYQKLKDTRNVNPLYYRKNFTSFDWDAADNGTSDFFIIQYADSDVIPMLFDISIFNNKNNLNYISFDTKLTYGTNSAEWTFARDDNTQTFDGNKKIQLQIGHWQDVPSLWNYEFGNIEMDRQRIGASSESYVYDNYWTNETIGTAILEYVYPITNSYGYFTPSTESTVTTMISLDLFGDGDSSAYRGNNYVWLLSDGSNFVVFTIGSEIGYSFYDGDLYGIGNDSDVLDLDSNALEDLIESKLSFKSGISSDNSLDSESEVTLLFTNNPIDGEKRFEIVIIYEHDEISYEYLNDCFDVYAELTLYLISYSSLDIYQVNWISYSKEIDDSIEFNVDIDSDYSFFQQISLSFDDPALLIPSMFVNKLTLEINDDWYGNTSNASYTSNSTMANYWQLELSARFDNCLDTSSSNETFFNYTLYSNSTNSTEEEAEESDPPGYARFTLYTFNESSGNREEMFSIDIFQTHCPASVDLYVEQETYFNPYDYINLTNGTSQDILYSIPFMAEWIDSEYSYLFKIFYTFNLQQGSDFYYGIVHEVVDPKTPTFWLLTESQTGFQILFSVSLFFTIVGLLLVCHFNCEFQSNHFCIYAICCCYCDWVECIYDAFIQPLSKRSQSQPTQSTQQPQTPQQTPQQTQTPQEQSQQQQRRPPPPPPQSTKQRQQRPLPKLDEAGTRSPKSIEINEINETDESGIELYTMNHKDTIVGNIVNSPSVNIHYSSNNTTVSTASQDNGIDLSEDIGCFHLCRVKRPREDRLYVLDATQIHSDCLSNIDLIHLKTSEPRTKSAYNKLRKESKARLSLLDRLIIIFVVCLMLGITTVFAFMIFGQSDSGGMYLVLSIVARYMDKILFANAGLPIIGIFVSFLYFGMIGSTYTWIYYNNMEKKAHEDINNMATVLESRRSNSISSVNSVNGQTIEERKELQRFDNPSQFIPRFHCCFILSDCCCRFMIIFIFTFTFYFQLYRYQKIAISLYVL